MNAPYKNSGFTLMETIIYIGLFGLLFSGIFTSIYPILTSADRLTMNVLAVSEREFMLAKINYILNDSLTRSDVTIEEPLPGATSSQLSIRSLGVEKYHLETGHLNCHIPLICNERELILRNKHGLTEALNNSRIKVSNLQVHRPPLQTGVMPNYIDISFDIKGEEMEPMRFYLRF